MKTNHVLTDYENVQAAGHIKQKARSRTPKTLRNIVHARFSKELPAVDIDAVNAAPVNRGYVKVDAARLTYTLP